MRSSQRAYGLQVASSIEQPKHHSRCMHATAVCCCSVTHLGDYGNMTTSTVTMTRSPTLQVVFPAIRERRRRRRRRRRRLKKRDRPLRSMFSIPIRGLSITSLVATESSTSRRYPTEFACYDYSPQQHDDQCSACCSPTDAATDRSTCGTRVVDFGIWLHAAFRRNG